MCVYLARTRKERTKLQVYILIHGDGMVAKEGGWWTKIWGTIEKRKRNDLEYHSRRIVLE